MVGIVHYFNGLFAYSLTLFHSVFIYSFSYPLYFLIFAVLFGIGFVFAMNKSLFNALYSVDIYIKDSSDRSTFLIPFTSRPADFQIRSRALKPVLFIPILLTIFYA